MTTSFLTAALLIGSAVSGYAVTIGQIDNFQDGTTMGWHVGGGGNPNVPVNVATGGPAGAGDAFLSLTATGGGGPGSKLAAFNTAQWTGDYIAGGIGRIRMSVRNEGPADIDLRLVLLNFAGMFPANLVVTNAVHVPSASGWQTAIFDLSPAALTVIAGTATGALSNVEELRIFHNPDPDYPAPPGGPPPVNATVGIDNIQAVPEPTSLLLVSSAFAGVWLRRFRSGSATRPS